LLCDCCSELCARARAAYLQHVCLQLARAAPRLRPPLVGQRRVEPTGAVGGAPAFARRRLVDALPVAADAFEVRMEGGLQVAGCRLVG
jgi:hypothetical protein